MATIGGFVALGLNVGHRRHRARRGDHPARRGRLLRGGQPGRGDHAPGPARAGARARAAAPGRLAASWPRSRPGLADGARYVLGGAARRRRSARPAAQLPVRAAVPDVDPAVPELLLPVQRRARPRATSGALVIVAGIGYACAALVTPPATRRLSKPAWITLLLAASAVVTVALGETFSQLAYLAIGFCLYLAPQGVAICATTILQEEVDDAYRGRVFAFYDMMFNVTYVAGAGAERGLHAGRRPLPAHRRPGGRGLRRPRRRLLAGPRRSVPRSALGAGSGSAAVRSAPRPRPSAAAPEWPAPGRVGRSLDPQLEQEVVGLPDQRARRQAQDAA